MRPMNRWWASYRRAREAAIELLLFLTFPGAAHACGTIASQGREHGWITVAHAPSALKEAHFPRPAAAIVSSATTRRGPLQLTHATVEARLAASSGGES
jgi:hypothetical protein